MDELVRWLGEQLDLDAARATAAAEETEPNWSDGGPHGEAVHTVPHGGPVAVGPWTGYLGDEVRVHIAEWDPARVLREIDAKRDLLRFAQGIHDHHETFTTGVAARLEETLRRFALAYEGRPGFREDWRP